MPSLPSLSSVISSLRGVAPRSQSAAPRIYQPLSAVRCNASTTRYTRSRPFTASYRPLAHLRGLSGSEYQAWNRCSAKPFSSSTRYGARYQYKRFEPPGRIPYPGQQGGGGGGGAPWWVIYRNELVIGVSVGGAFYLYNLETVEVSSRLYSMIRACNIHRNGMEIHIC